MAEIVRHLDRARLLDHRPHVHRLANDRYAVLISNAGGGGSACDGIALTRWQADPVEDADGWFVYLRDLDTGRFWSIGYQPTGGDPERYEVAFAPDQVVVLRLEAEIEATMTVRVAPHDAIERRHCRLANASSRPRRIEITSYLEVVLQTAAADAAHPAFAKLFVQTEAVADQRALLATRRPRAADERSVWLAHWLRADGAARADLQHETDRQRFIGRGRSLAAPAALGARAPLSGSVGNVLDPILCLRTIVELPPGASQTLTFGLGVAATRAGALALAANPAAAADPAPTLGPASTERSAPTTAAGPAPAGATSPAIALDPAPPTASSPPPALGLAPPTEPSPPPALGPAPPTAASPPPALGLAPPTEASPPPALGPAPPTASSPPPALGLAPSEPSWSTPPAPPHERAARYRPASEAEPAVAAAGAEALLLDNGCGGFADGGREYVMRITPAHRPPLPWTHVVANEGFGFITSESGASTTWAGNSRENRLTPWYNDPISDPHGEALYVRDEDARIFWSPTPGPVPAPTTCTVRYGFGWCRFGQTSAELEQEVCQFVPRHEPLKVTRIRLKNLAGRRRRLSVFAYARLVLGGLPAETARTIETFDDDRPGAILARNPARGAFSAGIAFAAALPPPGAAVHHSADRTAFIGRNGSPARPAALLAAPALDGRTGAGLEPCAALQVELELAPGASQEVVFLLGESAGVAAARALIESYAAPGAIDRAFDEISAFWRDLLSGLQIRTPAPALDLMANGWLLYQTICCRLWARSAFYQSGGAFGFRDQLQDAAALTQLRPELTRAQILLHAAHQFVEGDVLHWWHPPQSRGMRTRFSDDLLWLPLVVADYVRCTGDRSLLDAQAPFLRARPLAPGEDEAFLLPEDAGERASIYEHCCRALDRSLTEGAHGLPLMGTGDWNDGMNRVGRLGRGESVWLGFFLHTILGRFGPFCRARGDDARAGRYEAYRARLGDTLNDTGWDGAWYRRAYYDDGTPLGSAANDECRIDALAQAWAVISGVAPPERIEQCLDALETQLVSETDRLIRLLTPPFDRTAHDPGYIKGYVPGVRENGGQYTHAALWAVQALAEAGRTERAARLLAMLSPVSHARTAEEVRVYRVEPYVIAADVYGAPPHVGRGGWTWYTGSAGWMFRLIVETLLGCRIEGGELLVLQPRLPASWPECEVRWRVPGGPTAYVITMSNATGRGAAVIGATLDGAPVELREGAARVPIVRDGASHQVRLELG